MKDYIAKVSDVDYVYQPNIEDSPGVKALSDISLNIEKGKFTVIIGRNGSGKSTFAKLLNALQLPSKGVVLIKGMDTSDESRLWDIRHTAGMVFQNPDNQIVGTVVEEDVAFGPENLGVDPLEIRKRVDDALAVVGMSELSKNAPHLLSGGQKQRVAIAGILAMKPECIILDEATAMLDPVGRREVMKVLQKLNREEGITVVHITHHMDEAAKADRVVIFDSGRIVMEGSPKEVFSQVETVKGLGLDVPQVTELFYKLNQEGCSLPDDIIDVDAAFDTLKAALKTGD